MGDYQALLKDPRWQRRRLEVFQRDEWSCQGCGATDKTLHVHHRRYRRGAMPWDYPDEDLRTLCEDCHSEEHTESSSRSVRPGPAVTGIQSLQRPPARKADAATAPIRKSVSIRLTRQNVSVAGMPYSFQNRYAALQEMARAEAQPTPPDWALSHADGWPAALHTALVPIELGWRSAFGAWDLDGLLAEETGLQAKPSIEAELRDSLQISRLEAARQIGLDAVVLLGSLKSRGSAACIKEFTAAELEALSAAGKNAGHLISEGEVMRRLELPAQAHREALRALGAPHLKRFYRSGYYYEPQAVEYIRTHPSYSAEALRKRPDKWSIRRGAAWKLSFDSGGYRPPASEMQSCIREILTAIHPICLNPTGPKIELTVQEWADHLGFGYVNKLSGLQLTGPGFAYVFCGVSWETGKPAEEARAAVYASHSLLDLARNSNAEEFVARAISDPRLLRDGF